MKLTSGCILVSGLILTLVIFFSTLIISIYTMDNIRSDIHKIAKENNRKAELIVVMYTAARERVLNLYRMLDNNDAFARDDLFLEFNQKGGEFVKARAELMSMPLSPREKMILAEQKQLASIVTPQLTQLISLIQEEQLSQARDRLNNHSIKIQTKLLQKLETLLAYQSENSSRTVELTDRKFNTSKNLIFIWAVLAFLSGLFIAYLVSKGIRAFEQKLHLQIEQSNATLSSISDGVITLEEDGSIQYMNKMAIEILGDTKKGQEIWECIRFLNPEYKLAFTQMFRMCNQKDTVELGQYEISSNGKQRWIDICRSPVHDQANNLTGIVMVLRDVTEIKETQLALFKSNESLERHVEERTKDIKLANIKLEESIVDLRNAQNHMVQTEKMAALGGLVAGISHEINTPIGTSVTSATSIEENFVSVEAQYKAGTLTQDNFQNFVQHTRDGLDILTKNLRWASELIRSFKLIAVDQTSAEWREIDLKEYANEIITSLRPRLKSTNVQINCNIPDCLIIYTNPGAIYQILSNLILNSIIHGFAIRQATNGEAHEAAAITLNVAVSEHYLSLYYMDNGKGMDAETLTKVFDPFFTTRRGQGGSGLGMNIVFNIITSQLKGTVTADSAPGQGIYVEMKIPLSQAGEADYVPVQQSII